MTKIGVIDSGLGGLTVAKKIIHSFPNEEIIYFGDTGRCPYGNRETKEIKKFVWEMIHFLLKKDIKALVVACNTATAVMIDEIKERLSIPVFGVIDPAAKEAVKQTRNKRIGVIATTRTIESGLYEEKLKRQQQVEVFSKDCPLFVPLIESVGDNEAEIIQMAKEYLSVFKKRGIDTLVLGCTHYPLIAKEIQKVVGSDVKLIDSTTQIVKELRKIMTKTSQNLSHKHEFYVSGEISSFKDNAEKWLGMEMDVQQITFETKSIGL